MKELITRSLSGVLYIGLILGAIFMGSPGVAILMLLFGVVAFWEYGKMVQLGAFAFPLILGFSLSLIITWQYPEYKSFLAVLIVLIGSWSVFLKVGGRTLLSGIGGLVYIGIPLILAFLLTQNFEEFAEGYPLLPAFLFIWVNDTFAYLTGKTFGKHKLLPRISPGKTWEGFIGGFLITMGLGFGLDAYFDANYWWVIGGLVSIFSTLGDLFESSIKRDLGVKDSGNILPGHGGILDRIDSFLFVIPVYYTALALIA